MTLNEVLNGVSLGYKCPKCGSTKVKVGEVLTCIPPITVFVCEECGHKFSLDKDPSTESKVEMQNQDGEGNNSDVSKKYVGWICPRCGKVNSPFVTQCTCFPKVKGNFYPDYVYRPTVTVPSTPKLDFTADACQSCPNNPKNGGTGLCNCILGIQNQCTCTTVETKITN